MAQSILLLVLPLTSATAQADQLPYPSTAAICGESLPAQAVDPLLALEPALADSVRKGQGGPAAAWRLACARAQLADVEAIGRESFLMPLGSSWRHGASLLLARLLADSARTAPAALLARLNHDAALAERPEWTLRHLRLAVDAGIDGAPVLRGCLEQGWRASDSASVRLCATRGLRSGSDLTLHQLAMARLAALVGDTTGAWTAFVAATAAVRDSAARADLHWHVRWFLSPEEEIEWSALPAPALRDWLVALLRVRDVRDGRPAGARVVEHFRRLDFVEEHFRLVVLPIQRERFRAGAAIPDAPPTGDLVYRATPKSETAAPVFREFIRWQTDYDDRGAVWMRFGQPTARWFYTAAKPGNYLKRETWRYDLDGRSMLLSFESEQGDGSEDATRLVVGVIGDHFCGLDVRRCVQGERALEAAAWNKFAKTPEDRRGIAIEEVLALQREDRALIAEATTKDDNAPRTARHLRLRAQFHRIWDPEFGGIIALVPWSAPLEDVIPRERRRADRVQITLDVRSFDPAATAPQESRVATQVPVRSDRAKHAFITGLAVVAATPGTTAWSVLLGLDTLATGRVYDTDARPLATAGVGLSDLILGSPRQDTRWESPSGPVLLAPVPVFSTDEEVSLYYQVRSPGASDSASTTLALFRRDAREEKPALQLTFRDRVRRGLNEVRRDLGLDRLEAGAYRLEVRVSGIGGAPPVTRSVGLVVVQ
ncbi:MAG: hypothetical protein H6692_01720 [Gemmatimonadales bacterium]|nr:hypothetical protein [Gemmatimonadales bacterium]MCB9518436.1 hypothetical protein [Gemmatimonadales bacterium]